MLPECETETVTARGDGGQSIGISKACWEMWISWEDWLSARSNSLPGCCAHARSVSAPRKREGINHRGHHSLAGSLSITHTVNQAGKSRCPTTLRLIFIRNRFVTGLGVSHQSEVISCACLSVCFCVTETEKDGKTPHSLHRQGRWKSSRVCSCRYPC